MSDLTFVALSTYGRELHTDGITKQRQPTLKCTPVIAKILLTLYCGLARTLNHRVGQTYRYVTLQPMPVLKNGVLVLRLTPEELARVEQISRQTAHPWTYLWRDSHWWEFPTAMHQDYRLVQTTGSGMSPRFPPTSARFVTPSQLGAPHTPSHEAGLQVEHTDGWWWISGETYPVREDLRGAGARWSKQRQAWYFIGTSLPESIQALVAKSVQSEPEPEPVSPSPAISPEPLVAISEPAPKELVRVIAPPSANSQDPILQMVRNMSMSSATLSDSMPSPLRRSGIPTKIPQAFCGELTGAISGNVHCYGYALHDGICIYVNMAGPRMSIEAMRAKLSKGESITLAPWNAPAIELTAGEDNTGMYTVYLQSIPAAKFTSAIFVHERLLTPDYGGQSWTGILSTSDAQAMAKLKQHVTAVVSVPVFDAWAPYLWTAGQQAGLISAAQSGGGLPCWVIRLEKLPWTQLIAAGLTGQIQLPRSS